MSVLSPDSLGPILSIRTVVSSVDGSQGGTLPLLTLIGPRVIARTISIGGDRKAQVALHDPCCGCGVRKPAAPANSRRLVIRSTMAFVQRSPPIIMKRIMKRFYVT